MNKLPTPLFNPVLPDSAACKLLADWQNKLEQCSGERVLQWSVDTFGSQIAFASSWSEEDRVIDTLLAAGIGSIPVIDQVHTLLLPETWVPIPPWEKAHATFDGRAASAGLWNRFQVEHSCKKYEQTMRRHRAWIVSARQTQDAVLENMPILSWNERFGVFRIAPLAHWSDEKVGAFLRQDEAHPSAGSSLGEAEHFPVATKTQYDPSKNTSTRPEPSTDPRTLCYTESGLGDTLHVR